MFFSHLLLATLLATGGPSVEARTLSGNTISGLLESLDSSAAGIAAGGKAVEQLPVDQLLELRFTPSESTPAKPTVWIELVDGSRLHGVNYTANRTTAKLTVSAEQTVDIPVKAVARVHFSDPAQLSARWKQVVQGKRSTDLLALRKKETIDFLEGVVDDIDADTVKFELEGDTVTIKRNRVDGLVLFQRGAELPDPLAVVSDTSGWQLQAKSVAINGAVLKVVTVAGANVERPLATVARIDFSAGKVSHLGDLTPETSEWTSYFDFAASAPLLAKFYQPRADRTSEGPLTLGGKVYPKGLSLGSRTTLVYRLPAKAKQFQAIAGIDDAFREAGGSLRLEITGDDKSLFSGVIAAADAPRPLNFDVAGLKRLKIVVDYGGDLDIGDALDLCDARIVK